MKQIYVSPDGSDWNAGTREAPLKTIQKAIDAAIKQNSEYWNGCVTVFCLGGVHELAEPLRVSGDIQLTLTSAPGEKAVLSGGRALNDIREGTHNGKRLWTVDLPEVRDGKWYFRSLFAGGKRRTRAYLPRQGFYWMEDVPGHTYELFDGSDRFIAKAGDMQCFHNLTDAEIHVFHYWIDEHMPIASFDPVTRETVSTHQSVLSLRDDQQNARFAKYRVENIFEGLEEAGDWYLDRTEGRLYYLPEDSETPENTPLVVPVTEQLLIAENVSGLNIEDLRFEYTDWSLHQNIRATYSELRDDILYAAAPQGNSNLPGVISFRNARHCAVRKCEIAHVGLYAVDLEYACRNMIIQGNVINDMGAGGVKLNGAAAGQPRDERTQYVSVTDNDIGCGGRVFLAGIGVMSLHANHIRIAHNHIHDLYYTGVSCGWLWGYSESSCFDNTIEYNHIHGLGHGVLSDMGGVYTLSVQPGTVIRYNLIHDIEKANYGGWAIYPDEGSSHILIENNVCYDTSSSCFHQHYGRENVVRNNIWAFGREGIVAYSRLEEHCGFTFERNIILTRGQPVYTGNGIGGMRADANLIWDIDGNAPQWSGMFSDKSSYRPFETIRERGCDLHSVIADPRFVNPDEGDFTLRPDSPAFRLGFRAIDLTGVGVRDEAKWE